MPIKTFLCLILCCCFHLMAAASPTTKRDSLLTIFQIKDPVLQEKKLILDIRYYFGDIPENQLKAAKEELLHLLKSHQVRNQEALGYFVETLYLMQDKQYNAAEKVLIRAIDLAGKNEDHYLLYACFTQLAFLQEVKGNTPEAISSFRLAKKEALMLNDLYLRALININISDIYYKNNLYGQSLLYLDQAQALTNQLQPKDMLLQIMVWCNRGENYFRLGNADSLARYSGLLARAPYVTSRLYTYRKRMAYYLALLHRDYPQAMSRLQAARTDRAFHFNATDEQNLAEAWFQAGQTDSAKAIATRLLAGKTQENHPEVKLHLDELLGQIAAREGDSRESALQYQLALDQAKEHIRRLTQVDTISSQIKVDEMQGAYTRKDESYKRSQLWLLFTAVTAVFSIGIGAMLYRNVRQKRHYERLLFQLKRDELAFINSHEVRRHLSNILGIMEVIAHSEDRHEAYLQFEDHLLNAAGQLDTAIKNISAKLDEPHGRRPG